MRTIEVNGKTVEEAVQRGCEELGVAAENVHVEILSEPTPGLFGLIGSKQARVRLTEKITPENYLRDFLLTIMKHLGLSGDVLVSVTEEHFALNVSGPRMGMLIGKRGQTLNALQYLLNVVYHRHFPGQDRRVVLDVEDYREKREQTLRELAAKLARKVARYRKEVVLEPMSPQERRIIHTTLQGNPAVATYSQGEEPYRKVVIAPK